MKVVLDERPTFGEATVVISLFGMRNVMFLPNVKRVAVPLAIFRMVAHRLHAQFSALSSHHFVKLPASLSRGDDSEGIAALTEGFFTGIKPSLEWGNPAAHETVCKGIELLPRVSVQRNVAKTTSSVSGGVGAKSIPLIFDVIPSRGPMLFRVAVRLVRKMVILSKIKRFWVIPAIIRMVTNRFHSNRATLG